MKSIHSKTILKLLALRPLYIQRNDNEPKVDLQLKLIFKPVEFILVLMYEEVVHLINSYPTF